MIRIPTTMSTTVLTIRNLNGYNHLISNGPCIQCVRWKKKPIWLPTAKTKVFRIPVKPVIPKEEYEELKCLSNYYRTYMKSLKSYFCKQDNIATMQNQQIVQTKLFDEDFLKCCEVNDEWNKQIALEREQRLAKEREARENDILSRLAAKEERMLNLQAKVDEEIRTAKEEAKTFITRDNIDEAIEHALKTIVDPNAAIALDGSFYIKDYTKPTETSNCSETTV
ncbi:probable 28S ribosomal protein S26, mitochondrial isoform X2 [Colletes gigas]|nr:probable 28S ribosomal protein S26, mitochondrial isoform X2 [Colletes gigas]XP_043247775.1 probable 28S ribosomal protein S26, mitochondrial isoform X2 [Colletes gigas]XP_043247776.1 probable 28S ribosomal protein S26, mitochondrial isoform X2 [Colletes gigas]